MKKRQASKFYPYFDSEEKSVIDKMTGFFNSIVFKHQPILTDFLNPGERDILKTISGNDLFVQEFGGYTNAEKKRVYIAEDWTNFAPSAYEITPCEIVYPQKFAQLSHSAILGSLANSGIETDTFGDIITDNSGNWQIFVKNELVTFFQEEIRRIGRSQVKIRPIAFKDILRAEDDNTNATVIVTSLRIDAVLSGISKQSRKMIKDAITANLVKLNWHGVRDSNIIVKETDIISLRHFGRCQIMNISSTRKGKFKVVLKLWQTRKNRQKN